MRQRDHEEEEKERRVEKEERTGSQAKGCEGEGSDKQDILSYQKVMLRVATKFVMRIKEEKEPTLYETYISLVINCVGAVDMLVRDITVNDVWQMIRDKKFTYITGEDDEESEDEDLIGA